MEVYRSKDNHVAKYIHDDGSETAIKTTPLVTFGGVYGNITNKFNIFISTSVGCPIGCKFCYLTTKKCPYVKLTADQIMLNVYEALEKETRHRPELKNMYAKLSWMGMGDAFLDMRTVINATQGIETDIRNMKLAKGIDGVDIATTIPLIPAYGYDYVKELNTQVSRFNLHPKRNYSSVKSPVRVFYSLHSTDAATREQLIPTSIPMEESLEYISTLHNVYGITTVIHHMFFDGINDSDEEVDKLSYLLSTNTYNLNNVELRLLRFNECEGTSYKESPNFDSIVAKLHSRHKKIKVQSSPGSEVKAACGQFLLSKIEGKQC